MRFLVTAGPTREYLDDVRFLTNASSGRMGYAIARAAAQRGHSVDLVTGPVALRPPSGVRVHRATSAQEMYQAARRLFRRADCLIGAAAPADFTPVRRIKGKAKKAESPLLLRLKPTPDILATLGRAKLARPTCGGVSRRRQVIIAFALEVQNPLKNARLKLRRKNADAIVLNSPAAIGALRSDATILLRGGARLQVKQATKQRLGRILVALAESLRASRASNRH
jgi:phosphopantothenoylcysteine synthetase/decarboxylase